MRSDICQRREDKSDREGRVRERRKVVPYPFGKPGKEEPYPGTGKREAKIVADRALSGNTLPAVHFIAGRRPKARHIVNDAVKRHDRIVIGVVVPLQQIVQNKWCEKARQACKGKRRHVLPAALPATQNDQ